ncbi:phage major capsid protein [Agromyces sp. NBRC 114283]|uniref:phage major capsid protein n=1 Tax=Agromyces sp. NBRC 114283 TaxID=2994521 RepID=UPI0024A31102|nr:phage major capsid protein [Agromyces sp. NBRC 114283]GLU88947.1 putative structural protein - phage associated [Agromyces sp. NBRC 114283]
MAVLATSGLTLPKNIAEGLWKKAQTGSAIASLSGAEPQKFGEVTHMTLTGRPRAELVGEGADKNDTNATFGTKVVTPHKFQVTMRFNEEVQWADEDYQLGVLTTLADEGGQALARALDLGGFHGINPRAGTVSSSIVAGDRIASTTNSVEITTATLTTPDIVIEQAAGLVISDGYVPNGIAFDPTYSWTVATARYEDGRKKYPELGFGANITSFEGLKAYSSSTVSGLPEASANTNVKAIIGQWDAFRWGVQRRLPVELIKFGDPDGLGDLKRKNQIALRLEVVYGWGVMDLDAFATVKDAVANV